ncbi:MAG: hypothetical protein KME55_39455 [Nostoc indistinguendum CM1-VF10]|jgi:hypothetical protein|nr:hypothetical protein [Nostoc indistinguendum CM1-VF10]
MPRSGLNAWFDLHPRLVLDQYIACEVYLPQTISLHLITSQIPRPAAVRGTRYQSGGLRFISCRNH